VSQLEFLARAALNVAAAVPRWPPLRSRADLQKTRGLELIEECRRTPFEKRGKPEPLKQDLSGWWSRRVNGDDRLVYCVERKGRDQALEIIQCRLHY
jgi:Txe/YoeB family toxin of toxin-antitoxin system